MLGLEHTPPTPGTPLAPLFAASAPQVVQCLQQCSAEGSPALELLRVRDQASQQHRWLKLSLHRQGPDWIQGLLENLSLPTSASGVMSAAQVAVVFTV